MALEKGKLTLKELGNAIADGRNTSAGAVGTDRADLAHEELGTLDNIGLVSEAVDEDILVLEKSGVLEETEDLSEEGDGLLVELLGVANVGRDDLRKGKAFGLALGDLSSVDLRLDGKLATDGVLGSDDVLVDVIDGKSSHFGG